MITISRLTFIGFYLNGALGSGRYDDITISDVKAHIRDGSIFTYLETRLAGDIDFSIFKEEEKQELIKEWEDMADAVNESRKFCVDRHGLALLVAYLLEGIQRRAR